MANETTEQKLDQAAHGEGQAVPHTGTEALTTEHGGVGPAEAHHPDPAIFGLDATVWVSIAMATFLAILVWKKVPALIVGGLDKQIAAIRDRLAEAKALRAEAEALRDRKSTRLNSSHSKQSRMPSSA